jgi:predicted enzyme related to lactoylglutathione lyase
MKKIMDPVVHFEIPYEDNERITKFYAEAFGWESQILGDDMDNYVLVHAAERNERGFPKKPGRINGGFFKKSADKPMQYPSVVIAVKNIKESLKKIEQAGGKILGEPWNIPGYGLYVSVLDTEGNRIALMEPYPMN